MGHNLVKTMLFLKEFFITISDKIYIMVTGRLNYLFNFKKIKKYQSDK